MLPRLPARSAASSPCERYLLSLSSLFPGPSALFGAFFALRQAQNPSNPFPFCRFRTLGKTIGYGSETPLPIFPRAQAGFSMPRSTLRAAGCRPVSLFRITFRCFLITFFKLSPIIATLAEKHRGWVPPALPVFVERGADFPLPDSHYGTVHRSTPRHTPFRVSRALPSGSPPAVGGGKSARVGWVGGKNERKRRHGQTSGNVRNF